MILTDSYSEKMHKKNKRMRWYAQQHAKTGDKEGKKDPRRRALNSANDPEG